MYIYFTLWLCVITWNIPELLSEREDLRENGGAGFLKARPSFLSERELAVLLPPLPLNDVLVWVAPTKQVSGLRTLEKYLKQGCSIFFYFKIIINMNKYFLFHKDNF